MKVIIGFGSIWGLMAFGMMLISSFTFGTNDTKPEILAIVLYGATLLPACILAIWRQKGAAIWLIGLTVPTVFGFMYQVINTNELGGLSAGKIVGLLFVAAIPGFLGVCILRTVAHR